MSVQRINLSGKPVVAGVLVLLALVAAANVMFFKPGGPTRRAKVRVQSAQPLPLDISEFRGQATMPGHDLAAWSSSSTPRLRRDPFGKNRTDAPTQAEAMMRDVVTGPEPLKCNAILLGGAQPAVMINGKSYRVGDAVREYQVAAIGATGVKLASDTGPALFLSVHADREWSGRSRVITKTTQTLERGQTSLVEHARGERK